jgi:hypothetical protein
MLRSWEASATGCNLSALSWLRCCSWSAASDGGQLDGINVLRQKLSNQTVQPTGASRLAQRLIKGHRRLAPVADLFVGQHNRMRTMLVVALGLTVLALSVGCRTPSTTGDTLDGFPLAAAQAGIAVGTLKALDAGDTNRVYRFTLGHLRDSVVRMHSHLQQDAVPDDERHLAQPISQVVLNYLERQKDRLGQDPALDQMGLETVKVLSDILTEPQDVQRAKALQRFFSSRFVKEREFYQ